MKVSVFGTPDEISGALTALLLHLDVLDVSEPFASVFYADELRVDIDAELPAPTRADVLADLAAILHGQASIPVGELLPALVAHAPDAYADWTPRHVAAELRRHRIAVTQLRPGVRVLRAADLPPTTRTEGAQH
ncbi:hypothetical protein [Pseudofrankia sp. DC12]|uniref:hypothetical protein n=1 Tax=Pseudofrankia sp. DC12 TaxID=683315 RepID=UPI0005F7C05E|nr:hypothetical protein [Pseudofrankia sp. DC12]